MNQAETQQPEIKTLAIQQIVADESVQPRIALKMDKVEEYKAAIEAGAILPPMGVYFDGMTHWLFSGFHRRKSYSD